MRIRKCFHSFLCLSGSVMLLFCLTHPVSASPYRTIKTEACKANNVVSDITLAPYFAWSLLMDNPVKSVVINPNKLCLKNNGKTKLYSTGKSQLLAEVEIKSIEIYTGGLRPALSHLSAQASHFHLSHAGADEANKKSSFALVELETKNIFVSADYFRITPSKDLDHAHWIDRSRWKALQGARAFVFVTHDQLDSDQKKLVPKALTFGSLPGLVKDSSSKQKKSSSSNVIQKGVLSQYFPKEKGRPLILVGTDISDTRPIDWSYTLTEMGYNNLYIVKGGLETITQVKPRATHTNTDLKTLSAKEVRKRLLLAELVVDVREKSTQLFGFRIPGTKAISYRDEEIPQQREISSLPINSGHFNISLLPIDRRVPIVFFGADKDDQRPYKAAAEAKLAGYQNISIFRGGAAEWYYHSLKEPGQFRREAQIEVQKEIKKEEKEPNKQEQKKEAT